MKAFVKSNTLSPGLVEMDAMVGHVCELIEQGEDDYYVVGGRGPNSHRTWWFLVDDLVMEDSPDFNKWVSGEAVKPSPDTVTISRSDLQALQSLLKQEIKDLSNMTRMMKKDAKYLTSIGDEVRAGFYYKDHDKFRERTLTLEKRMKAVKKALT